MHNAETNQCLPQFPYENVAHCAQSSGGWSLMEDVPPILQGSDSHLDYLHKCMMRSTLVDGSVGFQDETCGPDGAPCCHFYHSEDDFYAMAAGELNGQTPVDYAVRAHRGPSEESSPKSARFLPAHEEKAESDAGIHEWVQYTHADTEKDVDGAEDNVSWVGDRGGTMPHGSNTAQPGQQPDDINHVNLSISAWVCSLGAMLIMGFVLPYPIQARAKRMFRSPLLISVSNGGKIVEK